MKPERWQQIESIFHAALERQPTERAAFLANACGSDHSLRREVESLLASHEQGGISLDASDVATDLLRGDVVEAVPGRTIGPYKILKPLGAGGMGAVFLAQDSRLSRQIALKLLPAEFTRDRDRLRRFEQEARAASALNHPNIVTVHDIGQTGRLHFIAMEFVDGVTLRERMARGRLKLREALEAASQVASALAAAHAAGIVHRDIKPENILLRRDGYIKVVDFGLAKLTVPAVAAGSSETRTVARIETATGVVMGTPHYMSPEQVRGATAESGADIFSFGAVLYEMLSGRRAFEGATAVEAMNAVLKEDPAELPVEVPPALQRIVSRCLEKDPERRFRSAEDLAFVLRALPAESEPGMKRLEVPSAGRRRSLWIAAAAALLLVTVGAVAVRQTELFWRNPLENAQFTTLTDFEGSELDGGISADGKFVVFLSDRDGPFDAFVTQVGSEEFRNLTHGKFPDLVHEMLRSVGSSADGAWLRVTAARGSEEIWAVRTMSGEPRKLLDGPAEAAWSPDGSKIAYHDTTDGDPIFIANTDGSNAKRIFVEKPGYHCHYPAWSPDGRFIYFVRGVPLTREMDIWRIPASGGDPDRITRHQSWVVSPAPIDDRTLLYSSPAEDGSGPWLYAIDVERRVPHRVSSGNQKYTSVSATADGRRIVATVANPSGHLWTMPVLDRPAEEAEAAQVALPNVRAVGPRYGPDYFLYLSSRGGGEGLWKSGSRGVIDLWKGSEGGQISSPAVSADGGRIAFTLRLQGRGRLYAINADGTGRRALDEALNAIGAPSWSTDGNWIAVTANQGSGPRLFKVPIAGGPTVQLTDKIATNPVWSPNGARIVYSGKQIGWRGPVKAVTPEGKPVEMPELWVRPGGERYRSVEDLHRAIERRELWVRTGGERYRFLPNGKGLVLMGGGWKSQQFYLVDLATGQERPLSNLKPGFSTSSFDVSPDGKQILFERVRENSDLVLIDLKR